MANLADFNLTDTQAGGQIVLQALRDLLLHIDKCAFLSNQRIFHAVTDYVTGQFERCGAAASKLDMDMLGWSTRNLFELSLVAEYLCASDQNITRFVGDCAIDDLEIWQKFTAIDERAPGYLPHQESTERIRRLNKKLACLGLTGATSLRAIDMARAVNRDAEYAEFYKVYSKLTHATAWAILGGSEEPVAWEKLVLLLLLKANRYAGSCLIAIAKQTCFPIPNI